MAKSRWISLVQITLWCSVAVHHPNFHVEAISNSFQGQIQQQSQPPFPISPKELRRLRAKGLEIMPSGNSISTNALADEPSCDELRAMWRYYRRNARAAELTNEIPQIQLEDVFWGLGSTHGEPQSFGPLNRGRNRPRFKPKGPRNPLYGKVLLKQEDKSSDSGRRRPMEQVIELIGPHSAGKSHAPHKSEPTILLTPPSTPTPKSGVDKIRDMLRDERVQEESGGDNPDPHPPPRQNQEYGKVVLAPPSGTDGRVANKPRELMTPFERIRFGHTDDLFLNDEGPRRRPHLFPVMKRRNGFIALPMLNRQKSSWRPFAMAPRNHAGPPTLPPSRYEDSIIIVQNPNRGELSNEDAAGFPATQQPSSEALLLLEEGDEGGVRQLEPSSVMDYAPETNPVALLLAKAPLNVEESLPLCSDVKGDLCSMNADCSCLGHGLYRCHAGQCQTLSLKEAYEEADSAEFWHQEPISATNLGAWAETAVPRQLARYTIKRKRSADERA